MIELFFFNTLTLELKKIQGINIDDIVNWFDADELNLRLMVALQAQYYNPYCAGFGASTGDDEKMLLIRFEKRAILVNADSALRYGLQRKQWEELLW